MEEDVEEGAVEDAVGVVEDGEEGRGRSGPVATERVAMAATLWGRGDGGKMTSLD